MIYGCGKFSEDAWTELVFVEDGDLGLEARALERHLSECPDCSAEFAGFARVGLELRKSLESASQVKEAFVARVMADVAAARKGNVRETEGIRSIGRPYERRIAGPAGNTGSATRGWLLSRPLALAAASALAIFVVFFGVLPWQDGREISTRSTGYTAPGGRILTLAERAESPAAALTTQGVAEAAAEPAATLTAAPPGGETRARPIQASLGVAAAAAQVNQI